MTRYSPHVDAIVRWLREQGALEIRIEAANHPRILFLFDGAERRFVASGTPGSEWNATRNAIRELRHMLGLVGGRRKGDRRRQRKGRPPRAPLPPHNQPARIAIAPPLNTAFTGLAERIAAAQLARGPPVASGG